MSDYNQINLEFEIRNADILGANIDILKCFYVEKFADLVKSKLLILDTLEKDFFDERFLLVIEFNDEIYT